MKFTAGSILLCVLVAVACVGEDVAQNASSSSSSSGVTASSSGTSPDPCADGSCDANSSSGASPSCDAPQRMCGADCVSVDTNPNHCGGCGQRCDNGCQAGRCLPTQLVQGAIKHFEVTANALYISRDNAIARCPIDAPCTDPQALFTPSDSRLSLGDFVVDGERLVFFQIPSVIVSGTTLLSACSVANCATPIPLGTYEGARPTGLSIGATHLVYAVTVSTNDGGTLHGLERGSNMPFTVVKANDRSIEYTRLAAGDRATSYARANSNEVEVRTLASNGVSLGSVAATTVTRTRIVDGVVWFAEQAGRIARITNNGGVEIVASTGDAKVQDFALEGDSLYWLNERTREVQRCAINDCANTGVVLAVDQLGLRQLEITATHVYWTSTSGLHRLMR